MRRREFIALVGGAVVCASSVHAQRPAGSPYRVGVILTTAPISEATGPEPVQPSIGAFVHGLRDLGYYEGQNLAFEWRSAEGKFDRFGDIASDLVRKNVDVILTIGNDPTREVKRVTSSIPIVMATSNDPVGAGLVASLARPGGNITGLTVHDGPEFETKRIELLKECTPHIARVAFLGFKVEWVGPVGAAVRDAAQKLGMSLLYAEHTPNNYADAFNLIANNGPLTMLVTRNVANYANRQTIVSFAREHQIPAMYAFRECADAGGLMSYGVSIPYLFRRAAGYVDKILKGANPADLPVEQPTKFELVINLKAAKVLGLTVPATLLAQTDEVIE